MTCICDWSHGCVQVLVLPLNPYSYMCQLCCSYSMTHCFSQNAPWWDSRRIVPLFLMTLAVVIGWDWWWSTLWDQCKPCRFVRSPACPADLTARTRWASTHVAPRCCGCRCCCCPSDGCQAAGEVLIKIAKGKLPACVDKESVKLGEMKEKGGLAMKNDR